MGEALWPYVLDFFGGILLAALFSLAFTALWVAAFAALAGAALLSGWRSEKEYAWLTIPAVIVGGFIAFWLCGWMLDAAFATPARVSGLVVAAIFPSALKVLDRSLAAVAPPSQSPPRDNDLPVSSYLSWPLPLAVALILASLLGAYSGSGGTPRGFVIALLLNPILWVAGWALWKIGQLRCPHCRRGIGSSEVRNAAVGSPICCARCGNWSVKPAG